MNIPIAPNALLFASSSLSIPLSKNGCLKSNIPTYNYNKSNQAKNTCKGELTTSNAGAMIKRLIWFEPAKWQCKYICWHLTTTLPLTSSTTHSEKNSSKWIYGAAAGSLAEVATHLSWLICLCKGLRMSDRKWTWATGLARSNLVPLTVVKLLTCPLRSISY